MYLIKSFIINEMGMETWGREKRPRVSPVYHEASFFNFYSVICLLAFFYDKLAVLKIRSS